MPAARCGPLRPPGFGNAGPVAGFLDLTLQGLREQWQEAECQVGPEIRAELSPLDPQVLGPGRITTLATTCEEFDTGSSCSRPAVRAAMCTGVRGERPAGRRRAVVALARRLGEYRDVVSSVFLRYCRGAQSGGERAGRERESTAPSLRPTDAAAARPSTSKRRRKGTEVEERGGMQRRRLWCVLGVLGQDRIPCWYNRLEDQTEDARDEEATEAFCTAANTSTCSFQKTSQARYTLRLEAEPCTPQPVKGSIGMSVFLGGLLLGFLACGLACALRARRELLTDYEDEFTEH
ncbi:unnamed protein product [Symbiodinium microadriaticum]|nr:unnamed protein product [Symbiodinium microadriaticum]